MNMKDLHFIYCLKRGKAASRYIDIGKLALVIIFIPLGQMKLAYLRLERWETMIINMRELRVIVFLKKQRQMIWSHCIDILIRHLKIIFIQFMNSKLAKVYKLERLVI